MMHISYPLSLLSLSLMAGTAFALPHMLQSRAPGGQVAVYWGQNGGGTIENNDLSTYCTSSSGIDILILSFLYEYGNGNNIASGTIGQSCYISPQGEPQDCDALASAIDTCKSKGVKVILSLGGAVGAYSLQSQSEAETIGQNLWEAYGNTANGSVPRPFGKTFVDGWDFDIESNSGNQYYQYMISKLRSNFASDSSNTYYITGAPQCPIPEPNMGEIITNATFDYLWVQFYNNPSCSNPNEINYDAWADLVTGGPSANAKIFIGVPASTTAATGTASGAQYYFDPSSLSTLVAKYDSNAHWGGVMMWSAGFSDANVIDGCTYAQQAKNILDEGSPCSGTGTGTTTPATSVTPTSTSSPTSTPTVSVTSTTSSTPAATGTPVPQWGQVSLIKPFSSFRHI